MQSENLNIKLCDIAHTNYFDFSKNTTYHLGGRCKAAYFPATEEETIKVFNELNRSSEKFIVLGKGSNVLASDTFYDGYVISTALLKGIYRIDENKIACLSGTSVSELLNFCRERGLSGLEFLAGIPASIGGLTLMNGGAGGKYISDVFVSAAIYSGKLCNFNRDLCNFTYKRSTMRDISCVILSVIFNVIPTSKEEVENNIKHFLHARKDQPKGKSCGCVFKNPEGASAGKLIDDCGLKGLRLGGASVSDVHANFIINNGGSARDVYNLINLVKKTVYEKIGVLLDEEVVYIGDFNDSFS